MIVVDTSVWVGYFNGAQSRHADRLDAALSQQLVIIGDLILVELLQGFRSDVELRRARGLVDRLEFRPMVGRDVALAAAQNFRTLRRRGVTVRKTIDVVIGTFCVREGFALLHDDRDFDPMQRHLGLQVVAV